MKVLEQKRIGPDKYLFLTMSMCWILSMTSQCNIFSSFHSCSNMSADFAARNKIKYILLIRMNSAFNKSEWRLEYEWTGRCGILKNLDKRRFCFNLINS